MRTTSNHFKQQGKDEAEIFKLLTQCISKFGHDNFKEKLKSELSAHHFSEGKIRLIIEHIIKFVLEEYGPTGLTRYDLIKSAKRGYVSEARKICIILIKQNIKTSSSKITKYFGNRSEEVVNKAIREHHKMDRSSKVPDVQNFIKKYDNIAEKVSQYVTDLKSNNTEVQTPA